MDSTPSELAPSRRLSFCHQNFGIILIETIRLYDINATWPYDGKSLPACVGVVSPPTPFLAALGGGGRGRGGGAPPGRRLGALGAVFVVRLELHLQEVLVLLADDLADERRQGLQVAQQRLQLGLQQRDPLLHVLAALVQVRHHVVHDVLSLQRTDGGGGCGRKGDRDVLSGGARAHTYTCAHTRAVKVGVVEGREGGKHMHKLMLLSGWRPPHSVWENT